MKPYGLAGLVATNMLAMTAMPTILTHAQEPAAQELQTKKQMEDFVAKASTAADHEQLRKHFLAMAAQYKADAETHAAMAARYKRNPGNPNRQTGANPAAHCDQVARQLSAASASATELAKLQERMATEAPTTSKVPGTHPSLPMAEPRYPDLLPATQAEELVGDAKTPADHAKLAKHFAAEATKLSADADRHAAMAAGFRTADQRGNLAAAASHCDRLAQQIRGAAQGVRELSTHHERLAAAK